MAELQEALKKALEVLYHHPDDVFRSEADRWLQNFQRTLDAWQVSDNLLHKADSNLETLIFCSQTLRSKVQRDFEELPAGAFRQLRDSLYALLKKFHKGPPKVRTQISIAVAALAVHVSVEDWGGGGIVNWLKDEMNAHPEYAPGFLELLTVLPQEAFNHKIAARPERRRQFEKELHFSVEVALHLLTACLSISELKEQILEAFASWLRLSDGIPAGYLASHPLVHLALSSLNSELLLEPSVNVVSELIHYTVSGGVTGLPAKMPLLQVIVPHVMDLKGQLRDSSKDEEEVKAIARLFCDMGDSYVELIAGGSSESMMIVQALLEVASHPEYDVSSMTYNFWHQLQLNLTRRDIHPSNASETALASESNLRLSVFQSTFQVLVSLVSFRVQYPQDYASLSKEDLKDFKYTRYAVSDVLMDATAVLGGEVTLKILFSKLLQVIDSSRTNGNSEWQPVEASLYCIQSIAKSIPLQESEVLPQVMSLLPKLPHQSQLLQTICATIGAYSKWLNAAPPEMPMLPSLVDILTRGMSTSEDTAAAAAVSFKYICEDCREKLLGSLDGLFHIYHIAISGDGGFKVSSEDSMHFVEALSIVLTKLPSDHAKRALDLLCAPAINPLQELTKQGGEILQQVLARQLTVHIDRLACIFRYVKIPEIVADCVQRFWPVFKVIFDCRPWDMRTMESLCRSCKFAVRTSGKFMGATIGEILEEVKALYQEHNQSCFLYLASEVIKIFGSDPTCSAYLQSLIEALFGHTTKLLSSIQDFTARPDIADDCFLLASRCIRYCPDLFVPSSVFSPLIDCVMIGITVQHRDACRSILTFLADVFDLANAPSGEKYRSVIDGVIVTRGLTLTRILIASLAGALPSSRIEEVTYVLAVMSRTYGIRVLEWAKHIISLIPSTAATEADCTSFLKALSEAASGSDVSSLTYPFEELSDVCRRNRAVQEIVQESLRPLDLNFAIVSS